MTNGLDTILTHTGDHGEIIKLQYDRHNRLYVNGNALVTETRFNWFERSLAFLVSAAVIGDFILSLLSYLQKCT